MRPMHHQSYLFFEESQELTNPENKGCTADNNQPICEFQRDDIKEGSSNGDYGYLSEEYDSSYQYETATILKMKCGFACLKCTGIKHVPKLQEYEDCEEET